MTNQEIATRTVAALQELYQAWGACPETGGSVEARAAGLKAKAALALVAKHAGRSNSRINANRRYLQRIAANSPW